MTRPILLLNAPAQSGKDTVASILETGYGFRPNSFKNPLFYLFCHTAGFDYEEFMDLYSTDGWKDTPNEKLNGKTPRDLMIHISENYIKPFFGDTYFGEALANQIESYELAHGDNVEYSWVIPDSGFNDEAQVLIDKFKDRVICVQFTRNGKTFEGDSRNWVTNVPTTVYIDHPNDPYVFAKNITEKIKSLGFNINLNKLGFY